MSAAQQLIPVPFYEDTIVLVGQAEQPFVAMKSVVENMGLAWQVQHRKLMERFASTITEMVTVAEDGKLRNMTCLPLRKLPAWLYSISPNKVKPELRDKIIRYQNECDDALWDYWSKGSATRPGAAGITQQLAVSRHRLALLKELHRTRDRTLREAIHQQLDHASRLLGLSTPELNSIGWADPEVPDVLADFWDALEQLEQQGVKVNHSKNPRRLALHLITLGRQFKKHQIPVDVGAELRQALRQSRNPRFVHRRNTASAIEGKGVNCWVFERITAPETAAQ
ncbi:P22_AR N-terminal domain-containing protein [Pseudomonas citronellolis]|uniref:P22_AR N-terminal domain-containing protein n=1 Tax=Pseudomonas citronellolis TaxID=53408 RepID=A0AAQ1HMV3_9PSED|nr:phage antirepressor N-terminal domain-containing protein [Pseudomonas citronellolis]TGC21016.1 hypothetical protein CW310_31365 [Pseudomonas citronellolis]SFC76313.1 P22_AR N-terminal domain-containing protein [Pseudomonas citronellolis]